MIRLKKGKGISKIIYTLIDICQRDQSKFSPSSSSSNSLTVYIKPLLLQDTRFYYQLTKVERGGRKER